MRSRTRRKNRFLEKRGTIAVEKAKNAMSDWRASGMKLLHRLRREVNKLNVFLDEQKTVIKQQAELIGAIDISDISDQQMEKEIESLQKLRLFSLCLESKRDSCEELIRTLTESSYMKVDNTIIKEDVPFMLFDEIVKAWKSDERILKTIEQKEIA